MLAVGTEGQRTHFVEFRALKLAVDDDAPFVSMWGPPRHSQPVGTRRVFTIFGISGRILLTKQLLLSWRRDLAPGALYDHEQAEQQDCAAGTLRPKWFPEEHEILRHETP